MVGLKWGGGPVGARVLATILVGTVAVSLTGCGVRLEGDPLAFPSPDEVTVARDSLADAEAGVLEAAAREGANADAVAVGAADAAETHLEVLGGVYVAYPSAPASPTADATASAVPQPALAEVIATARAAAESVAASTTDADLAFLARSISLEWALRELFGASLALTPTDGTSHEADPVWFPRAAGTTNEAAGFAPGASTALSQETLGEVAVREDEARFAYETLAAQEFGPRRDDALARSRLHADRADALAALLDTDPRTPLYQLRDADLLNVDSRRALERSVETDLGARYAALLDGVTEADEAWLLNASFDAYARAMRTDGFTAAEVPTLPGLTVIP